MERVPAPSAAEAVRTAQAMVPTVPGALALCETLDGDGRVVALTVLGTVGRLPEEWIERLTDQVLGSKITATE